MTIKAAVISKPGKVEVKHFDAIDRPKGGILVKVFMSGICGTDRHIYDGKLGINMPCILGHENVGYIEEVEPDQFDMLGNPLSTGDMITWAPQYEVCGSCYYCKWLPSNHSWALCDNLKGYGFSPADEYPYLTGGWAEKNYLLPGSWIVKLPESMPPEVALLSDCMSSVAGIERAASLPGWLNEGLYMGSTVVVQGAGTIGFMAAVVAQLLGATKVIMVGGPQHRLSLAKEFGVQETVNISQIVKPEERIEYIKELSQGVGPDVVIECAGVPDAVPEGLEMVRKGGAFIEIGHYTFAGMTNIDPAKHICHKDVTIFGQYGYVPQQFRKVVAVLDRYKEHFPFHKLVTHHFPLEDVEKAINTVIQEECIKAVIKP